MKAASRWCASRSPLRRLVGVDATRARPWRVGSRPVACSPPRTPDTSPRGPARPRSGSGAARNHRDPHPRPRHTLLPALLGDGARARGRAPAAPPSCRSCTTSPPPISRARPRPCACPRRTPSPTPRRSGRASRAWRGPPSRPASSWRRGRGPRPRSTPRSARPSTARVPLLLGRMAKARPAIAAYRAPCRARRHPRGRWEHIAARDSTLLAVGERHRAFDGEAGVHITGFVDDETVLRAAARTATALVNPSRSPEPLLVLLEAWACGVPVVVNAACDVTVSARAATAASPSTSRTRPRRRRPARGRPGAPSRDWVPHGKAYVERRYAWDCVTRLYEAVARGHARDGDLNTTSSRSAPPAIARAAPARSSPRRGRGRRGRTSRCPVRAAPGGRRGWCHPRWVTVTRVPSPEGANTTSTSVSSGPRGTAPRRALVEVDEPRGWLPHGDVAERDDDRLPVALERLEHAAADALLDREDAAAVAVAGTTAPPERSISREHREGVGLNYGDLDRRRRASAWFHQRFPGGRGRARRAP